MQNISSISRAIAEKTTGALLINMESPIMAEALTDMDEGLSNLLDQMGQGGFTDGKITLEVKISLASIGASIPVQDENGAAEKVPYHYKCPKIEHTVGISLKRSNKKKGLFMADRKEIRFVDGQYIIVPIPEDQMTMEEYLSAAKSGL